MGKRRYQTPEDFERAVDAYFEDCEAKGVFPDEAGMLVDLNIGCSLYEAMRGVAPSIAAVYGWSDAESARYKAVCERARFRRESWLSRRASTDNKAASGCTFLLKQQKNGGFMDRASDGGGEIRLTVKIGSMLPKKQTKSTK